ncbi:MAG: choice-of-anchor D domain-containing protein [bacterium]|nr:choice-of-anchor D domain-containing protein [bacterium]
MFVFDRLSLLAAVCAGVLLGFTQAYAGYTALHVFGGSLEEIGNNQNFANRDGRFWPGRKTNGKVYVELVAESLDLGTLLPSSRGGTDYAWAPTSSEVFLSASDRSVETQVTDFITGLGASGAADPDALYILNGNMRNFYSPIEDAQRKQIAKEDAEAVVSLIRLLAEKGARWFAVVQKVEPVQFLGTVILSETQKGAFDAVLMATATYNNALGEAVGLAKTEGLNIFLVPFREWVSTAQREGLILNYVGTDQEPSKYFNLFGWGSDCTPTASAHAVLARIVLNTVNRGPVVANAIADLSFQVGDAPKVIHIQEGGVFVDEDQDNLTYTAASSKSSVVEAVLVQGQLELTPVGGGTARITITATDGAKRGELSFQVTVKLLPGAILVKTPSADFGEVEVNRDATVTLAIQNTGAGPLMITDVQSDITGVVPSATRFTIPVGELYDLKVTIRAGSEGAISGALTILSNDPDNGALHVVVSGSAVVILADPKADFNADGQINLSDFILFARAFGFADPAYDLNGNGSVDLGDFILFAQAFSRPFL